MKKIKLILLLITILLVLSGISYADEKLSKPENLRWSDDEYGILMWDEVENAEAYEMEILKDGAIIGQGIHDANLGNTESIREVIKNNGFGMYTIKVWASSSTLEDSDKAEIQLEVKALSKPENLKWSSSEYGILTWDEVENAEEYVTEVLKDGETIATGSNNASLGNTESIREVIKFEGYGMYTIKIWASSSILGNSEKAEIQLEVAPLSKPENFKWDDNEIGLLTWDEVENAEEYGIQIFKDEELIGETTEMYNAVSISEFIEEYGYGKYIIKVWAKSEVLGNSESTNISFEKIDKEDNEDDQTEADGKIPQTGLLTVISSVIAFALVGAISIYKYKNMMK